MREGDVTLPDGRTLAYLEIGDPRGDPALILHGFPGCRFQFRGLDGTAETAGLRLLAPDRPGIGRSTPRPGRSIGDWAADVRGFLDALEVERAHLAGVSAGGAFAVAVSARLPRDRLGRVALVSSVCPWRGLRGTLPRSWFAFFWAVHHVPYLAEVLLARELRRARDDPTHHLLAASESNDTDQAILAAGGSAMLRESFLEACRQGVRGVAHEARLLAGDWDVDLAQAAPGARVWHGLDDGAVHPEAGRFLARTLPAAELTLLEGEGHVSALVNHAGEVLGWLAGDKA